MELDFAGRTALVTGASQGIGRTTARMLAGEHSSGRVFILPAILAVVLLFLAGTLVLRRQRRRRT